MKILKKITAAIIICIMAMSLIGCHPKDEIAVTIDGQKYTSAYYMAALLNAYTEAQNLVYNDLSEEELSSSSKIDFSSKKVEGKAFDSWVKDTAIESLKQIAYYKSCCEKNELKLTDEQTSSAEYYASLYWSNYGYSQLFEPNGVSLETYKKYMLDGSYSALYFEHLYGKDGEKEIASKTVKSEFKKNFILANMLEVTFSEETDAEKKKIGEQFEDYYKALKNGKKTFEEIYVEYNNIKEEDHKHEENGPKDPHATVIGAEGTGYEHDYYKDIKKLDAGEIKLIKKDDNAGYLLVIKQDISADKYYLENMDMTVRHLIKDEEFTADSEKAAAKLTADINKYAVNQFKVNKIVEPSYQ